MTSAGLGELKRLINEATVRKASLNQRVEEQKADLARALNKLAFAKRFIIRLFTRNAVPELQHAAWDAETKLQNANADLAGCHINVDFGLDKRSENAFAALSRSFSNLCGAQKLWDITNTYITDRAKERTTAIQNIARTEIRFEFGDVDLLRSDSKGMKFNNASGLELYLLPGFILTKERGSDFALIEWKDVSVEAKPSNFIETDPIPSDSQVVSYTWARANKDGSPDRRFVDNHKIPVARYGELWFRSPAGLYEAYMISSQSKADDFATAIQNYRAALAQVEHEPTPPPVEEDEGGDDQFQPTEPRAAIEIPPFPYFDLIVLVAILFLLVGPTFWASTHRQVLFQFLAPANTGSANQEGPKQVVRPNFPSVYVVPRVLNIRARGSTTAPVILKATRGSKLTEFRTEGEWSEVGAETVTGWALTRLLSRTAIDSHRSAP